MAWVVTCLAALALGGMLAPAAMADPFGIQAADAQVTAGPAPNPPPNPGDLTDPANFAPPYTQAGGHPYELRVQIRLNRNPDPIDGDIWPSEPVKDLLVDSPPGLVGNPTVVAKCRLDELAVNAAEIPGPLCPSASQVGMVTITFPFCPIVNICFVRNTSKVALYAMVPPPSVPARFAFNALGTIVTLDAELRSGGDYGLSVNARGVNEGLPIIGTSVTLWGSPADLSHTPERSCPGEHSPGDGGPACAAGIANKPFLTLPTACNGPLTTTVRADSWFHPGVFQPASVDSHVPPGLPDQQPSDFESPLLAPDQWGAKQGPTGCDQVPFDPTFTAAPDTSASPGASGWTFDLTMPQDGLDDPNAIAESHLKKAVVTLPVGVRVSPSSADGLGACSPAQIALGSAASPACPDSSKVGTVTIDTPLLDEPLTGSIYLATPHDNPSGSLLALYLVAEGQGVVIKLPGSVSPDATTGRLSATFDNNPQVPFSNLRLAFFGGDRAALSNPPRCGTYTTSAVMTSWSGKTVTSTSSFTTSHDGNGAPCPPPHFTPTFSAGATAPSGGAPQGGSSSMFSLSLSRSDDDEELAALQLVNMPDGLLAKIRDVPLCAPGDVAAGTCGDASRIGTVTTTAGPGPHPFAVKGRVYIGGPYKGAPFSLSIVVPAVAGPFDLGTIVVRSALFVDPVTAKLAIVTDPIPTILQGIPLQVRTVNVTVDRPGFMVNPTSCDRKAIGATAVSTAGTVAELSSRFQVAGCGALPFAPKIRLAVGSKGHTKKAVSTPFSTTLTQAPGQAGLKSVSVTLPRTLNALLPVVDDACTQAAFDAGHCGRHARAGQVAAVTPLLAKPLRGAVYFVKNPARGIPDLVVALRGQVDFNLVGKVKIPNSGVLSAHFDTIPDVPVTRFTLDLVSGKNGPIGTVTNLCRAQAKRQVAHVAFRGQNGKLVTSTQRLQVRGCGVAHGRGGH